MEQHQQHQQHDLYDAVGSLLTLGNELRKLEDSIESMTTTPFEEEENQNEIKPIISNKQSEFEDEFLEYAYENGLWGLPDSGIEKEPSEDEILKMRNEFTEKWIELHGDDNTINYNIFDKNPEQEERTIQEEWNIIATEFHTHVKQNNYLNMISPEYKNYKYAWLQYLNDTYAAIDQYQIHTLGIENNMKGIFPNENMFDEFLRDKDIFL